MIEIDGSFGEAGGQITRTAVGLSVVTQKPVRIFNIRKGRPVPGLKAQHMKGVEAAARLCNAQVRGLALGSQELEFCPKSAERKNVSIDVGTAGSVTLVLQTLMIPASVSQEGLVFEIRGGTHVAWSPTTGYFRHVFCEFLKKMGISASSETLSYGFYPKGGGGIRVKVKPARRILPLSLTERGEPLEMEIWSCASRDLQKGRVAERQADQAESVLGSAKKSIKYVPSASTGSAITIASNFASCVLGASSLGERGKAAERVGDEAATLMKRQLDSGACLDEWMADQILPYIALAEKRSRIRVAEITQHAETNMRVIEKFLPVEFSTKDNGKNFIISCETS